MRGLWSDLASKYEELANYFAEQAQMGEVMDGSLSNVK